MRKITALFLTALANIVLITISFPAALLGFYLDYEFGSFASRGLIFFCFCALFISILISLSVWAHKSKNNFTVFASIISIVLFVFFCKTFGDAMMGV